MMKYYTLFLLSILVFTMIGKNTNFDDFSGPPSDNSYRYDNCQSVSPPFTQDFESITAPNVPNCATLENAGNGNNWETYNLSDNGFNSNVLRYKFSTSSAADAWYFTRGIDLNAGTDYEITYIYGNSSIYATEKLKIAYGTSASSSAMNTTLANHPSIDDASATTETVVFNVSSDDTYYFGFNAYSDVGQLYLYVDSIVVKEAPNCLTPTNLSVDETSITANSAEISWTDSNNATKWEVIYDTTGFDPSTEGTSLIVHNTPDTTLDNLSGGITYDVYVRAICSANSESSFPNSPLTFTTSCIALSNFSQDFSNVAAGEIPSCWSRLKVNSTSQYTSFGVQQSSLAHSAPNHIYLYNYLDASAVFYLITPELTNLDAGTHRLRFYYKGMSTINLEVGTMSDVADASTFNSIQSITTSSSYEEYIVNFNQNYSDSYIALKISFTTSADMAYIDNISWETTADCISPQNLTTNNISTNTADLSWNFDGTATQWKVTYGSPGFDLQTEGTSVTVHNTPDTTLHNLSPNTEYEVYVKTICSNGNSVYSSPIIFITDCASTTLPFSQGFENVTPPDIPHCATIENTGDGNNWKTTNLMDHGFSGHVLFYEYSFDHPADAWYFTQGIELQAGLNYKIIYTYGNNSTSLTEKLKVAYGSSASAADMNTVLVDYTDINEATATRDSIIFSVNSNGTYYFGFNAHSETNQYNLYVDSIVVKNAPSCPQPTAITLNNLTSSSVDVTWNANEDNTSWKVVYGPSGFDPETDGTTIVDNDGQLGVSIQNLSPMTDYELYVKALCGNNDQSAWAGPKSFTTLAEPPVNDDLCDAIDLMINNGCSGATYTNIQATPEPNEPDASCLNNFQGTNSVWFSFEAPDAGEVNISTTTSSSTFLTEIVVYEAPTDCADLTTLGQEVGCISGNSLDVSDLIPNATYYIRITGFDESQGDFCIEVQADNYCEQPTDITSSNITHYSADISWNPNGSETKWKVIYGLTGFDVSTEGTTLTVNNTPETTIDNLESNTTYDVYVRAVCGQNHLSDLTGPESFTTTNLAVEEQAFHNFRYYPNPVRDQLNLKAGGPIKKVVLYDLLGQKVKVKKPRQIKTHFSLKNLSPGIYLMKVSIDGNKKTFKIIKK